MRAALEKKAICTLRLLLAIAVLLSAGQASAMTTTVAGMCDPVGASAPAPLPAMPARGGAIDVLDDCEELFAEFGEEGPLQDSASLGGPHDAPKPALLASFTVLKRPGTRQPAPVATTSREQRGHRMGVFRPPRG